MVYDREAYIKQPVPIRFELRLLFKRNQPLVIFDIGACEGEESIRYSRLFPKSEIYTFEPLPANIQLIENNFLKYGVTNASLQNKAVSSKDGVGHLYVSSGEPKNIEVSDWDFGNKSSSLLEPSKHLKENSFLDFKDKIEVETITLKSFCDKHKLTAIDFIHMDVQGGELMVLQGAFDLISSIKVIWLEVSRIDFYKDQPLVDDIKKFMVANQFSLLLDGLDSFQGDHLYISKLHFSTFQIFLFKQLLSLRCIWRRLKAQLKK